MSRFFYSAFAILFLASCARPAPEPLVEKSETSGVDYLKKIREYDRGQRSREPIVIPVTEPLQAGEMVTMLHAVDRHMNFLRRELSQGKRGATVRGRKLFFSKQFTALKTLRDDLKNEVARNCAGKESSCAVTATIEKKMNELFKPIASRSRHKVLMTGYFAPEYQARKQRTSLYRYPLYPMPSLQKGKLKRLTRYEIDYRGALEDKVLPLAGMKNEMERFLVHVLGSARLVFGDGTKAVVGYAGDNGKPYVSLGRLMIRDKTYTSNQVTNPVLVDYFEKHPERFKKYAKKLPRYIFFRFKKEPMGSTGVPVTAMHSIAVDPKVIPYGAMAYLDAKLPVVVSGKVRRWEKKKLLVFGQDTGSGIRGNHIDLFVGFGDRAGDIAGRLKDDAYLTYLLQRR